jgi:hypothetical protein
MWLLKAYEGFLSRSPSLLNETEGYLYLMKRSQLLMGPVAATYGVPIPYPVGNRGS